LRRNSKEIFSYEDRGDRGPLAADGAGLLSVGDSLAI
jgi:hypothetical protein